MNLENVGLAFGLTLFAGLATGVGSLIAFFSKKFNPKFLAVSLGFSAGAMIYVSFVEIFFKAQESLSLIHGQKQGQIFTVLSFFAGILLIGLIDHFIPNNQNPHEIKEIDSFGAEVKTNPKLMRMGVFSALAIGIHNFPEGLATFIGALDSPSVGISIAIAVAIHNIPEGLAVSVPIYYATKSRTKAFLYSFLSLSFFFQEA
jgi:ZIP family zinc transporter